jgi:LytS/YehU family sensor histidine kinase
MNSLNTLVGLIWESPKKASDMIVALGAEVRNILEIPDIAHNLYVGMLLPE